MSFPFLRQRNQMDCGPTSLYMVSKYYGRNFSMEKLRMLTEIGKEGVNILGISDAAEQIGFRAIAAQLAFYELRKEVKLPCILHWNQNHFVVLYKVTKNKFIIADPAKGIIKLTSDELKQSWISSNNSNRQTGIALLLEPTAAFYEQENEKSKGIGWGLLLNYAIKYKAQIFQLFLGLLLGSLLQLIFPFLTQSIVDTGINTQNLSFIQLILIAQFTLFFARTIVDFIRSRILLFVSTHINLAILSDFWIKLMKLPLSFFDTKQTGDILQRINDHKRIESFITGTALQTIFSIFNLITFSFVLLYFNTTIFTIFATGSILYFFWIRLFLKYRRKLDYSRFAALSKENSATMQLIHGMQEIKLNNAEHLKRWEWESLQASVFKLNFKSLSLSQYQQAGAFFINEGKNIFITYIVATLVLKGNLTLGEMLAIQYIIGQLNSPVEQLIHFSQQAQDAKISLERLNEIHQLNDEEPSQTQFNNHLSDDCSIQLQNLNFTYAGAGNQPVLKTINTTFPSGKVTAIVGMSGSGKTTILKLIQKFYETYQGEIKIGESSLKYVSPFYWRSITGSVMQDGFIFSDSIEKNIAVSDENPDYKKLIHACKVANILSFIESMPLGFNTKIGAEGNGISAGQKQRILIARAVYKNPQFLFFDEATNALDANNEKAIMENLHEFFKGRTVIVVAHRLSTVKDADKIIVLQNGEIIEEGNHNELTNKRGKYYELVKNQLELGN
ncbi:MAG: peptidase domain-containing ABC transporter [Bacteroidetes bacterium]|nr:peptidase domain-containing ABC transporter [Bacteroidota bacterium]